MTSSSSKEPKDNKQVQIFLDKNFLSKTMTTVLDLSSTSVHFIKTSKIIICNPINYNWFFLLIKIEPL